MEGDLFLNKILNDLFHYCEKNIITRQYIFKIKKLLLILYPSNEFLVNSKTMYIALKSWIIMLSILGVCSLFGKLKLYGYAIIITMLIVINQEVISGTFRKYELLLLRQMEKYLGEVRHYFHMNGVIEDAIYDSLENADYEISLHINIIYDILVENSSEASQKYKDLAPNKFLLIFLGLCEGLILYGDTIRDDKSMFLENINNLRDEIRTEILKIEKMNYVFSGLTVITIVPPFTLKLIEIWGESNIDSLTNYYDGRYGLIVSVLICIVSLLVYRIILMMRDVHEYNQVDLSTYTKISEISFINKLLLNYMFNNAYKVKLLDENLRKAACNINVKAYIMRKWIIYFGTFIGVGILGLYYKNLSPIKEGNEIIVNVIIIIFVMFVPYTAGKIPDFLLKLRIIFMKSNMENEVLSFHSIIIMLMYIKRMDVETILEWLENYAEIFKNSLSECSDNYSYDSVLALENLKEKEPYMPFVRIVENLEACDNVGIEQAFEEIHSQKQYYIEKRKQDNEINISNKGAIGRFIAFIPMVATIGLYLIIPFVMESIKGLMESVNIINGI